MIIGYCLLYFPIFYWYLLINILSLCFHGFEYFLVCQFSGYFSDMSTCPQKSLISRSFFQVVKTKSFSIRFPHINQWHMLAKYWYSLTFARMGNKTPELFKTSSTGLFSKQGRSFIHFHIAIANVSDNPGTRNGGNNSMLIT